MSMNGDHIDKMVNDTIESFDGAVRAQPKPFLFARISRLIVQRSNEQNIWMRIAAFISRPSVAIAGIALLIIINAAIIYERRSNGDKTIVQINAATADEFAINSSGIYEFENIEP